VSRESANKHSKNTHF